MSMAQETGHTQSGPDSSGSGRQKWPGLAKRWVIISGAVMFSLSLAALIVLDTAAPGQRWSMLDLQIYRWAGLLVHHSSSLYGSRFPGYPLRFTYPPMAAAIFAIITVIPLSMLKWLITAVGVTSLTVTVWLAFGLLGYQRSIRRLGATLGVTAVALWLAPVQETLGYGQVNVILMVIIMADFSLPDKCRLKGIGVGLTAGFKLTPLIFIPYVLITRQLRSAAVSAATFALTIAGSAVVLPQESKQFWLDGAFLHWGRTGNTAYVSNQSLHGSVSRLLGNSPLAMAYWIAVLAIVGGGGLLLASCWTRSGQQLAGILTCALTGLLVSPVSWIHHWVWVVPALALIIHLARRPVAPCFRLALPGTRSMSGARLAEGRWRWFYPIGMSVLATAFFVSPLSLVPAAEAQGKGAHGAGVLAANLYVAVGLVWLCLAGSIFIAHRQASADRRVRAETPPGSVPGDGPADAVSVARE